MLTTVSVTERSPITGPTLFRRKIPERCSRVAPARWPHKHSPLQVFSMLAPAYLSSVQVPPPPKLVSAGRHQCTTGEAARPLLRRLDHFFKRSAQVLFLRWGDGLNHLKRTTLIEAQRVSMRAGHAVLATASALADCDVASGRHSGGPPFEYVMTIGYRERTKVNSRTSRIFRRSRSMGSACDPMQRRVGEVFDQLRASMWPASAAVMMTNFREAGGNSFRRPRGLSTSPPHNAGYVRSTRTYQCLLTFRICSDPGHTMNLSHMDIRVNRLYLPERAGNHRSTCSN